MAKSPRISISVTARQLTAVEAEAKRLGLSVADVVRRVLDQWVDEQGKGERKRQ